MKKILTYLGAGLMVFSLAQCDSKNPTEGTTGQDSTASEIIDETVKLPEFTPERFADLRILQYEVPGFDELQLSQKKMLYYLVQAAHSGRDIIYDQKYKHNLRIRKTNEAIFKSYKGEKSGEDWDKFVVYAKRVWFASGIHHHYAETKMIPEFSPEYFAKLVKGSDLSLIPVMEGQDLDAFLAMLKPVMFDPTVDGKHVNKAKGDDLLTTSANNFYSGVTQEEADKFYKGVKKKGEKNPISYGLNSQLAKVEGESQYATGFENKDLGIVENLWCVGGENHASGKPGMYAEAMQEMVNWLKKAADVAENEKQKEGIEALVAYYLTGDLKKFDEYSITWAKNTEGDIDFIHGFIEVYGDPIGFRGSYESVIFIKDKEASKRMTSLGENAQWFEDNAPIPAEYKKKEVKGISYKVITVINEAGDAAPSTPIGINLPNSNWIRQDHGSKAVSLGNIEDAYHNAGGSGTVDEFYLDEEVKGYIKKYGTLASNMHTAMHEVLGHASGQIKDGVGTPKETLKNYSSTLEEARADLFGLYYVMEQKVVDLGLMPSTDVAKAEYNSYITNGMMLQLRRLNEGDDIEEDHMRNRQVVAKWCFEKGKADNVIEKKVVDGKTYFVINDYDKLRELFGQLLSEIQRIKSEGDFAAGEALVVDYGVKVDQKMLKEVKSRYEQFNMAPYSGFLQPRLVAVEESGEIVDVIIEYPTDFVKQMLDYGDKYSFVPVK